MSEANEDVKVVRRGRVLEITLDRPKVNAIDLETSRLLGEACVLLRDDPALRVGIITGGGERIFSAGWTLKAVARPGPQAAGGWGGGGMN